VCSTMLSRRGEEVFISADWQKGDDGRAFEYPSDDEAPDVATENVEFHRIVHEEVERLPAVYGSVMALFLVQDLSYEEIVEVTGLPLGTVKVRLFRARSMLRNSVLRRLSGPTRHERAGKAAAKL
ncbi:MAG: sigma factor-like helix-turn-helix DNA-binding protein, partial [Bacteroidota bacterium]